MATKDWVKYAENEESAGMGWFIEYYRRNDQYSYVKAWHTSVPLDEMKKRGHVGAFIVGARIGRDGIETKKYFRTKQQAISYAMGYMRSH